MNPRSMAYPYAQRPNDAYGMQPNYANYPMRDNYGQPSYPPAQQYRSSYPNANSTYGSNMPYNRPNPNMQQNKPQSMQSNAHSYGTNSSDYGAQNHGPRQQQQQQSYDNNNIQGYQYAN